MSQILAIQIIPIKKNDIEIINYSFGQNDLGLFLIASTSVGICHLSFGETCENLLLELAKTWPTSKFIETENELDLLIKKFLSEKNWPNKNKSLQLHLQGTPFQLQVWQALLTIPFGEKRTYTQVAQQINRPKAVRAVASSIGKNSVAYLIPCHRVISSNGNLAGFRWGLELKKQMLEMEKLAKI